jgi:hypothetical protein
VFKSVGIAIQDWAIGHALATSFLHTSTPETHCERGSGVATLQI